jgi:hypothetical protein
MTEVTQSNKRAIAMCFLCTPRSSETSFSLIPGIFGFYLPQRGPDLMEFFPAQRRQRWRVTTRHSFQPDASHSLS